ncbi:MAG: hypothetical protein EKK52_07760 [Burkholderiales bacterium]|nr:MAG: hypothetical protein EKK52_07760 [Burkholderiales bacterium]
MTGNDPSMQPQPRSHSFIRQENASAIALRISITERSDLRQDMALKRMRDKLNLDDKPMGSIARYHSQIRLMNLILIKKSSTEDYALVFWKETRECAQGDRLKRRL